MVMRAVMDEFVEQMKPLQEKYHLERESQFNWYEYPECADLSFYDTYTTYPGINYVVKDATLIWRYLPTGTTKVTDDVPNFKIFNDAAIALADEETRKEFVRDSVQRIEGSLLGLLK